MRKVLYKQVKKQYDSFTWTAEKTGEYVACFSNEFSTFSHKLVYIDFQVGETVNRIVIVNLTSVISQVGDEDPLPGLEGATGPLTQVISLVIIRSALSYHHNIDLIRGRIRIPH